MTRIRQITNHSCAYLIGLSLLMLAPPAWAYLDPSTGSMILSAIVGLFATLALAVKTYWYKLKSFLRRDAEPESVPAEEQSSEPETSADR
jgi:hypothetical protein